MSDKCPPESWGPETALRMLEEMGRGDGPLAKAFRSAQGKKQNGALIIASTFRGPEGGSGSKNEV